MQFPAHIPAVNDISGKKWLSILWPWGGWASLHFSVYNIIHADRKCCVCLCSFIHFCTSYELPTKLIFYYSKKWQ